VNSAQGQTFSYPLSNTDLCKNMNRLQCLLCQTKLGTITKFMKQNNTKQQHTYKEAAAVPLSNTAH
jgi:hypothetical protein